MDPAKTLEKAIFLFDPIKPLSNNEELENYYVDRGSDVTFDIKLMLRSSDLEEKTPIKPLFTGHKGSGKSTEINNLCRDLDDYFFVVRVVMRKRPDVTYVDVLLKTAMSLFRAASDEEIIKRAPAQIAAGIWETVSDFVEKKIFGEVSVRSDVIVPSEFTAKVNVLGIEFEGKFDNEPVSRDKMRHVSEQQITEVVDKINLLADAVRSKYGKPVLFVFEDTDKLDPEVAKKLFYERGQTITDFRASAIFLMDISLYYSGQFNTIKSYFQECYCLPNIKLRTRDGKPYAEGESLLNEIIARRIEGSLLDEEARKLIIQTSGGLIRSLIALMRNAALAAAARQPSKIEKLDAVRAIGRLRNDFIASLESKHYPILRARHEDKRLSKDEDIQDLLERLALLEYRNDGFWCDVHPIILEEVEERTKEG